MCSRSVHFELDAPQPRRWSVAVTGRRRPRTLPGRVRNRPLSARPRLLPTEQAPLHIFEPRYVELIEESLAEESEFGILLGDDESGLREIGTRVSVIEVLERLPDGRLNIAVEGGERFRVVTLTEGRSFQTAEVEPFTDEDDDRDDETAEKAFTLYQRLAALVPAPPDDPRSRLRAPVVRDRRAGRLRRRAEAAAAGAPLGSRAPHCRVRAARTGRGGAQLSAI